MGSHDALLKPLTIKNTTIRNRIVSTAHAPAYDEDRKPKDRYQLYHAEKAKGGIGLVMFGGSTGVAIDSEAGWGQLSAADDSIVPYFRQFAGRVHEHGAKLIVQLTHMGRKIRWDLGHWLPTLGPSHAPERLNYPYPKAMEDWDIRRVIQSYGHAARRCQDGGLDGIELSAHAHQIFDEFWSPHTNKRTDDYGGSFEKRLRFPLECAAAARAAVGNDFLVGMRMSVDELIENGMDQKACLDVAVAFAKSGIIDFLNLTASQTNTNMSHAAITPSMAYPIGVYLHYASAVKAAVDIPVFHASRIPDLATAARAVAEGHVDMVGMTRAHIADPHIVNKMRAGREDDIRQCVGAGYCVDRLYTGGGALCIQNPATSRERTMPHVIAKAERRRTVVVVGAGPGGMEAARVSAERGHRVVLFESQERTGGQINLAARVGWREPISGIARWLDGQVRKLGVDLRLGTEATADAVLAERPDEVIIATGGVPNRGRFADSNLVHSAWDVLEGRIAPAEGQSVLVYDDSGDHQGVSCAEYVAGRGAAVEIATPDKHVGFRLGHTNRPIHVRNLHKAGAVMTPDVRMAGIEREGNRVAVVLRNDYTGADEARVVDYVVVEHGTLPREDLYFALRPKSSNLGEVDLDALAANRPQTIRANSQGAFRLFRIGDAVVTRNIHAAIYDALRLCKDF
jgi:2,4-dienoyl-CoA reductase-like NADH-dependent reductase (Old Yellow Enzyme family)